MSDEFKLPDIGEGLAEGEIVKWLVAVGDTVAEDQPLVEVMTDKATVEIPSPRAGTVVELSAAEGDVVQIGATILVFGDGGAADDGAVAADTADTAAVTPDDLEQAREAARAERDAVEAASTDAADTGHKPWEAPALPGGAVAPAARRLATELGVDVGDVTGSGSGGLVTKDDVRAFADDTAPAPKPAAEPAGVVEPEPKPEPESESEPEPELEPESEPEPEPAVEIVEPLATPSTAADGDEERVALRGLRRTIAERMVIATTTVPHYTYVEEVDMTEVVALRQEAKAKAVDRGIKLTYLPFIIRALVLTLKDHPYLNASLDEDAGEIVLKRYYNVGVATATDRGLMVPVVRGADGMDLFDLAAEITRLSDGARDGKIALEDLQGGTFTITSTGNIGGFLATPVINVPEVAILAVTAIRERPVVRDGQIVIRHMLNLSLSCDHRVVDGAVAALFVRDLVKLLEDPKLQLLAIL
ncbi:MAG: 2-oxo acid dehydrogenase subunit E2 [Acidobacteria bacterium]|nr:2-oxo acid dehydrogenase subunit E2 [Acidobacteriota bacterium]